MPPETVDEALTLDTALERLAGRPPYSRPFGYRIESACNAEMADVISLHGLAMGSTSEAIRDLIARGGKDLQREREAFSQA